MLKYLNKIKEDYFLDTYSLALFFLVSISFITSYKITSLLIISISLFQFYRYFKSLVSVEYFFNSYFFLLVYSVIFFRTVHTIILIILLLFITFLLLKNKNIRRPQKITIEILILFFFGLILINLTIFTPRLQGLDTYLYLLFYPILFLVIKSIPLNFSVTKLIKVFIFSTLIASFTLIIINLYSKELSLTTNTFFAKSLDLTHVYFGMFLGVAACFILILNDGLGGFVSLQIDFFIFLLLTLLLIYTGARTSLLTLLLIFTIFLFKKLPLKGLQKSLLIFILIGAFLTISYKTIPRARSGIEYLKKVYTSVKTNNKEDLIHNSWRNAYQRFLVTDFTIKELKNSWLSGIGLQNVKNKISDSVLKEGYIYFKPINTHNQYLQVWVGMGVFPLLFFIIMLIFFYKNQSYTLYFLSFFLIIMLTESMLVRVKGISLFFIFSLIFSFKENRN